MLGGFDLDKVYNQDCLEGVKLIPDNSVDLVITDPPYMMDYQSNRRTATEKFEKIANDKDSFELICEIFKEYHRVLKDNTQIYVFCSWHHIDKFKIEFEKYFTLKNILVWNKNNHGSGDLKGAYAPKYELVLYGHKGKAELYEKRIPDVIDADKVSGNDMTHPTEKPVDLLNVFVRNSSKEGDIVLDCFAGTGSTLVTCLYNKRKSIGFELNETYAKIANDRLDKIKTGETSKNLPRLKKQVDKETLDNFFGFE